MVEKALVKTKEELSMKAIEEALVKGNLRELTAEQRCSFYKQLCESLDLNPLTKPFAYIELNGKLQLYALKDCAEQLRSSRKVSILDMEEKLLGDVYVVRVKVANAEGRTDIATGAVCIKGLSGENLANAYLKCETKAKRRATLSICGLGFLDETEVETIKDAKVNVVNVETGEDVDIDAKSVSNKPKKGKAAEDISIPEPNTDDGKYVWDLSGINSDNHPAAVSYLKRFGAEEVSHTAGFVWITDAFLPKVEKYLAAKENVAALLTPPADSN